MKATIDGRVLAESEDIVERHGYHYFPTTAARLDWLEVAPKTDDDRQCPHGVQFYDVVTDGHRHDRAAWIYEAPQGDMKPVADRVAFWQNVEVG